ncbi:MULTISPECIES: 5-methyltetrahydropteroyltriglutamate--homocysteine methyltransferase [Pseudoalteromonas]|uniref:5-methyltetrahydropteroyltriglutamate--homocysteine methyltransferase n=1 Tax=Pseudoalteromonas obscura TaxID=3048491 RepID=A0ABT7ESE9_9GAMM|nr:MULTISPECIES: 5-methyltetrahydropteroyltriglutamate--homocysteine methyltransferase [Pseudoalteromonas]MBQ4835374.1 5-methyltetrahydropteroyltriglutamate--homocysteine methyltransferase [Pseudoalteromonas luteoviolacea]MDK2597982.1 5-methyltetrahydropteroyltriglutamate--homocysteine methyltransferase [Pseudoalteromonas sp. P94(2023)]
MKRPHIPTEQIGSIPRTAELIEAYQQYRDDKIDYDALNQIAEEHTKQVLNDLADLGCSVVSDGEQRKFDGFAHYCLHNSPRFGSEGLIVDFSDGHRRVFAPHLKKAPFKYENTADEYLAFALKHTHLPVKQAVISPSMLSLVYPAKGIEGYSHQQFIEDLVAEHVAEVRRCLALGAHKVQIDFTEARLSLKLDPSGGMLSAFVELINRCLSAFSAQERQKIGVHTCPGADIDATHSAEIDYKYLLPTLFKINAGNFYVALKGEREPRKVLRLIGQIISPEQRVFIGVTNPIDPIIEKPEEVCELIIAATEFIPIEQLGTTDDCGFSPFADDVSTGREIAYQKIRARLEGTKMAEQQLFEKQCK